MDIRFDRRELNGYAIAEDLPDSLKHLAELYGMVTGYNDVLIHKLIGQYLNTKPGSIFDVDVFSDLIPIPLTGDPAFFESLM